MSFKQLAACRLGQHWTYVVANLPKIEVTLSALTLSRPNNQIFYALACHQYRDQPKRKYDEQSGYHQYESQPSAERGSHEGGWARTPETPKFAHTAIFITRLISNPRTNLNH
jgi:hypothetical protein